MRFDSGLYAHAGDVATYPQVDEWRDEAKLLDEAGFTTVWVAEHHFFWDGWATPTPPNPILAGADLAAHTKNIRIGQCGVCLPDWHPVRVAEDIAMLDHMSNGRVDFGIIKGLNSRVNGNFNIHADRRDKDRNTALFLESLDLVIKAWTQDAFVHHGEFYQFPVPGWKDVSTHTEDPRYYNSHGELIAMSVLPKPRQKPHPPIWQMADSLESHETAAERGIKVMCWGQSFEGTREVWTHYREVAGRQGRELGPGEDVAMMRPTYVAPTQEEAERDMRDGINALYDGSLGRARWEREAFLASYESLTDDDLSCDWFDFLMRRDAIVVGSPDHVAEKIARFRDELSCRHYTIYMALAGMDYRKMLRSLTLLAEQVKPRFEPSTQQINEVG